MPSEELNAALAAVFRANGNNFKPFLRVMFRSEEFYGADIIRNQVKSPVQWLVGSVRMLESELPPPHRELGHAAPAWARICSRRRTSRAGMAASLGSRRTPCSRVTTMRESLVEGTLPPLTAGDFAQKSGGGRRRKGDENLQRVRMGGVSVEKILTPEERADKDMLVAALEHRLFQTTLNGEQEQALREFLDSKTKLNDADILTAIRLVMSTPAYQVT